MLEPAFARLRQAEHLNTLKNEHIKSLWNKELQHRQERA